MGARRADRRAVVAAGECECDGVWSGMGARQRAMWLLSFDGPRIVVAVHAFLAALAAAKENMVLPTRSARPIRSSSRAVGFTAGGAGVVGSSMACEEQWAGSSMIDATGER